MPRRVAGVAEECSMQGLQLCAQAREARRGRGFEGLRAPRCDWNPTGSKVRLARESGPHVTEPMSNPATAVRSGSWLVHLITLVLGN